MSSLYRGDSVPLLYVEEADSFSIQRRKCVLYTEESLSSVYIDRIECLSLLYREENVSLFFTDRRECLSLIYRGESVSLFLIER